MLQMMPGGMPGATPQAGNGMSLQQFLAMLQQSQGGAPAAGGMQLPPPGTATPMSNYIGAPGAGGPGMMRPAMAPVGNPQPQQMGGGMVPGATAQGNPLMAILAQLKAGQTGVQPGQGGVPGNTPSALTMGPNGMLQGTPGQMPTPAPAPAGPPGMPDFGALRAAGAFQPPGGMPPGGTPGAVPGGGGQMNPALLQWLHGMFNGGAGGGAGGGMGAGGGG